MLTGHSNVTNSRHVNITKGLGTQALTNASAYTNPDVSLANANEVTLNNETGIINKNFLESQPSNQSSIIQVNLPLQISSESHFQTNDSNKLLMSANSHPSFLQAPDNTAMISNNRPGPQARRRGSVSKLMNKKWLFNQKTHNISLNETVPQDRENNGHYGSNSISSAEFNLNNSPSTYLMNDFAIPPLQESTNEFYDIRQNSSTEEGNSNTSTEMVSYYSIKLTPYMDHSSPTFEQYNSCTELKITEDEIIKLGRDSRVTKRKREAEGIEPDPLVVFYKSKVISRTHAHLFIKDGKWFVRDIHSASGTFINHSRVPPSENYDNCFQLKDGDILQLGANYRGPQKPTQKRGYYQAVKLRVELNRIWQEQASEYNKRVFDQFNILNMNGDTRNDEKNMDELNGSKCVICLASISPCQSLFISRCSHVWHYKCIRPLIVQNYPIFECPCCRAQINLEDDVD